MFPLMGSSGADGGTPRSGVVGGSIMFLAFLSELAMLGTLAGAGLDLASSAVAGVALAVLLPLMAAVVWGVWLAPASRRRLRGPALLMVKILLFCLTAIATALAGHRVWAVVFAVTAIAATAGGHRIDSRTQAR
ncbi:hypothetical protein ThrDRAFT_03494 [Frankia casuarinae]|nr:hypothetical protein ThrDRAFT_03494 [Frankia casuarinae]KFB02684.1 Protein of unknown function (DUF2568) [Frankia sp. Allo2]OAA19950.1 Protein of unknown function (DUF2568) [Frankia casuarinae]TFE26594.1 DUF2568 domain-containing protein [Frankia sp. B2]